MFAVSQSDVASSSGDINTHASRQMQEQHELRRTCLTNLVIKVDSAQHVFKPTLVNLPTELLGEICQYVRNPRDLSAFAEVMPAEFLVEALRIFDGLALAEKTDLWLRYAVGGELRTIQFSIDSGIAPEILNVRNEQGNTALIYAALAQDARPSSLCV